MTRGVPDLCTRPCSRYFSIFLPRRGLQWLSAGDCSLDAAGLQQVSTKIAERHPDVPILA